MHPPARRAGPHPQAGQGHLADGRGSAPNRQASDRPGLTVSQAATRRTARGRSEPPRQGRTVDITQHLRVISRWRKVLIASAILGLALAGCSRCQDLALGRPERRPAPCRQVGEHVAHLRHAGRLPVGSHDAARRPRGPEAADDAGRRSGRGRRGQRPNSPAFADPGRLSLLAIIYSFMSQSNTIDDQRQAAARRQRGHRARDSRPEQGSLPMFQLNATAETEARPTRSTPSAHRR